MACSPAQRRYNRRSIILSLIYAAVLIGTVYLLKHHLVAGPLKYVVGVLPGIAVSSFFVAMGLYIVEEQDEYLRMLQVRQVLIATGICLTAATIWGFLEGFELVTHVEGYAWPVVWFAGLGMGAFANRIIERGQP